MSDIEELLNDIGFVFSKNIEIGLVKFKPIVFGKEMIYNEYIYIYKFNFVGFGDYQHSLKYGDIFLYENLSAENMVKVLRIMLRKKKIKILLDEK